MPISQSTFAAEFRKLRPGLIQAARRLRRCQYEDAEDLVSEVVLSALPRLHEYAEETGRVGLHQWILGILYHTAQRNYRAESYRVTAEPLALAQAVPADGAAHGPPTFTDTLHSLPRSHYHLAVDWLDGYSQDEIAHRNRLHRNTVGVRLEEAFAMLRVDFPDVTSLAYSFALFALCSQVSVYRKPVGVWRPWQRQHPPERPFGRGAASAAPETEDP
jgi:DNA-directed RNA polymerase specialized sigma24 family protein